MDTGSNIYAHGIYTHAPQADACGSHQQSSGMILAGYFTTLLGRTGRVHLNLLVSWHGPSL